MISVSVCSISGIIVERDEIENAWWVENVLFCNNCNEPFGKVISDAYVEMTEFRLMRGAVIKYHTRCRSIGEKHGHLFRSNVAMVPTKAKYRAAPKLVNYNKNGDVKKSPCRLVGLDYRLFDQGVLEDIRPVIKIHVKGVNSHGVEFSVEVKIILLFISKIILSFIRN